MDSYIVRYKKLGEKASASDPTRATYNPLSEAYDFFNDRLFDRQLPSCLITMQRSRGSYGYFHATRFATRDGAETTDEIALNPRHFRQQSTREILSTLVHEMVHLAQHHFGKPSRGGYHNKQWVRGMVAIGLVPSDTGKPGGKMTGQKMSHYVTDGGMFDVACSELESRGLDLRYGDLLDPPGEEPGKPSPPYDPSKTKYNCPDCGINVWGKPGLYIACLDCNKVMEPAATAADPCEVATQQLAVSPRQ